MLAHVLRSCAVVAAALAPVLACGATNQVNAQPTKPESPAEGAKDYDVIPGGQPTGVDTPEAPASETGENPTASAAAPMTADCPPKCTGDGVWVGCGLKKPRGSKCNGCTAKCKRKGSVDEGWYDCAGVLIVQGKCSDT